MRYLFLEADELGQWLRPHGVHEEWQDHGMGLLVTMAREWGYNFDVLTLKNMHSWAEYRALVKPYDVICMNVRSWRYRWAKRAAEIAKKANPNCHIWVGGMHVTVAGKEMTAVPEFDIKVTGQGESALRMLLKNEVVHDPPYTVNGNLLDLPKLDDVPFIDRELWPKSPTNNVWPLEGPGGWGPGPRAATMLTGRMCPYHCSFCYPAERNHFGHLRRRSVANVLEELAVIDQKWGPITTVLYHDSEFLMQRKWLESYIESYPKVGNWPFWASCRSDMMARWPDIVETLIKDCNWHTLSIGLESGSQRVLDILNKECTIDQHYQAIELVNRIGDEMETKGQIPPVIFSNIMLAIPGEEPEDAFETLRMLGKIKRQIPSVSFFTPYPGSTLGDRIIEEGNAIDPEKEYLRFPNKPKVKGVDYQFYTDLLYNGKYDAEVGYSVPRMMAGQGTAGVALL